LNPWFITGFSDAESSFIILVQPRSDSKTKWRVKATFAIGLHIKDTPILEHIRDSLGVGRIYISGTKVYYRVEAFDELQVVIDHFDTYPLVTAKKVDYELFKECFHIIKLKKQQLASSLISYQVWRDEGSGAVALATEEGLQKIINIKSARPPPLFLIIKMIRRGGGLIKVYLTN